MGPSGENEAGAEAVRMRIRLRWTRLRGLRGVGLLGALLASAALGCQSTRPLGDTTHEFTTGGGMALRVKVQSVRELRFRDIVPQTLDYSCGAAALATLLKYHYDDPVPEAEIIKEMIQHGDPEKIKREGFSLLDLKKYAERRGYATKGFRIGPDVLDRLAIPSITLVHTRGYSHFVVLKGARDGVVYLADPALGQRDQPQEEFVPDWESVVFFVAAQRKAGSGPSPLEAFTTGTPGRKDLVRELDFGLANVRAPLNVREF